MLVLLNIKFSATIFSKDVQTWYENAQAESLFCLVVAALAAARATACFGWCCRGVARTASRAAPRHTLRAAARAVAHAARAAAHAAARTAAPDPAAVSAPRPLPPPLSLPLPPPLL